MAILFTNNAYGSLSGSISAVATTINLASGNGARFPSPGGSDYFLATLIGLDGSGNENSWEIVKVTGRSTDALTVVRGQEGTTAAIWASGTRIELRVTKGTLEALPQGVIGTDIQAYDGDLAAIAALAGTSGFLKKTGTNTWTLDTSTYLTANQSITLSGDASGSGSTAITVTLATVTAAKGGTGQSTYAVGDLLYASGTSALTKLSGNTTTNKRFLTQTGTGSASAAPGWNAIVDGDVPSALTGKTYNGLTLTAAATGFTIAGGTTSKTLTMSNTLTFSGTDGSTLNIGTGGTLGTGAYATIANYATLASPTFTGTPAAPTAAADTNTTQIATTAYVVGQGYLKLSGGALTGGLREYKVAMSANDINLNSGNYFTKTFTSGAVTLTASNVPSSPTAASFILDATNAGLATIAFGTGFNNTMKWVGGVQPTLTSNGRDVLGFFTHDGGTTWTGLLLGKDVK